MAQKCHKWPCCAISRPGSSKLVDHCGSRLDQVRAHPGRCVGTFSQVRNGHQGRQRVPKWLKKAVNGPFVAISRPGGSKLVDLRGSRLDQVRAHPGVVLGPFPGSGMAIGGRHRTSKRPKMAINGCFVAISRPGGSKRVD